MLNSSALPSYVYPDYIESVVDLISLLNTNFKISSRAAVSIFDSNDTILELCGTNCTKKNIVLIDQDMYYSILRVEYYYHIILIDIIDIK